MDVIWWLLLAAVYLVLLVVLGIQTLKKGHTVLFFVGLFIPLLWIVGAVMGPTDSVRTAQARANLR